MPKLIVGNWKMNGTLVEAQERAAALVAARLPAKLVVCPPFVHVPAVAAALAGSQIGLGAQDCHAEAAGAFTGDVSAPMLAEIGCRFVILGHSERRHGLGEADSLVRKKALAAIKEGLTPIICVGETLSQREAGEQSAVVTGQLSSSLPEGLRDYVVAYEPVWAIGTGRNAAPADVAAMHEHIRRSVAELRAGADVDVLYGGSVKPGNAAALLALKDVDGLLVGGASLVAADFIAIAQAA